MEIFSNPQIELANAFIERTNKHIFLTGKAGTGKTTFLRTLRERSFKRMVVVAPTGVAAINAGGVTIHSFFQLSFGPFLPEYAQKSMVEGSNGNSSQGIKKFNREKLNIIRSLDLLVIDEISMVRADVLDAIDHVLRHFRDKTQAFGGVQLLMIGDIQQLAPVVKDEEWGLLRNYYSSMFFFGSKALQQTNFVSIELKHIYRQTNAEFIELLNKVRDNRLDAEGAELLNKRYIPNFSPNEDEGYISLTTHNNAARSINDQKLSELSQKPRTFKASIKDDFPEYMYPTDFELTLKVGAQVMFVKNDSSFNKLFYNGKIGKIQRIDDDIIFVKCPGDYDVISVGREEWQNQKFSLNDETKEIQETVIGTFTQYPLKLAWAITIHKSQGLTFERAIIDAQSSFAHGQVYVALSRCKTLEGLVLSTPIHEKSIKNDASVQSFSRNIEENPPTDNTLDESKRQFQQSLVRELFQFKSLLIALYHSIKVTKEHALSINGNVYETLTSMNQQVKSEISDVAEKFTNQLNKLFSQNTDLEKDDSVQERIRKGCEWFLDKIENNIIVLVPKIEFVTDNKQARKSINEALAQLLKEAQMKKKCLEACVKGFEVQNYLKARALMAIDDAPIAKAISKSSQANVPKNVLHPDLYINLRAWRNEIAIEFDVDEYQILPQKTLIQLANDMPVGTKELKAIKGIGSVKLKQFGAEILEIINSYTVSNNIKTEIPSLEEDVPVVPKVNSKQLSYELFKAGKSIEDIAVERDMAIGTIEGHLAYYVGIGEIGINEVVENEKLKLILACFQENGNFILGEAKAKLSDDISWGDLRLVAKYLEFTEKPKTIEI